MEETSSLIDSSNEETPFSEEIRTAYEDIKIPDSYEMLLAYEKLSVEIKRQNKELRRVGETLEEIHDHCFQEEESYDSLNKEPVDRQALLEEHLRREYRDELKKKERVLLGMMDSVRNLLLNVEANTETILSCLPRGRRFFFDPLPLQKELLAATQSFSTGVKMVYDKALAGLADYGIDMIDPQEGEMFSVMEHRAIERVEGKIDGSIARVVSVGYRKGDDLIRSADVIVSTSSQL